MDLSYVSIVVTKYLITRAQLLEKYQQALNERDKILNLNSQCQHKIAEHFRKKKGADERQEVEKSVTDQEQRLIMHIYSFS